MHYMKNTEMIFLMKNIYSAQNRLNKMLKLRYFC